MHYTYFGSVNNKVALALQQEWSGGWKAWSWVMGVGTKVITPDVWRRLSGQDQESVIADCKALVKELEEKRLKREEWEDNQAKWEQKLLSWLPAGIQPGEGAPPIIISHLYNSMTPHNLSLYRPAYAAASPILEGDRDILKAKLAHAWPRWNSVHQWAAAKLVRLYVNRILKVLGDHPESRTASKEIASVRAHLVVYCPAQLPYELVVTFMPFIMVVAKILGRNNMAGVDPVIDQHFVPYLVEINFKWAHWEAVQRVTLLQNLQKVGLEAQQATPTSVEDLLDRLSNREAIENALNLVHFSQAAVHLPGHLRLAEQTNYFRKLSPEEEAEGSRTLRSIGHRSALHHGTTKARWEAQWA
ncbi:hypothetical protein JCM11641_002043 [Rhodosporidiobolus odoratus]